MSSGGCLSGESLFHTINQDPPSLLSFRLPEISDYTSAPRAGVPKPGNSSEPLGNYKIQIWESLSRDTESGPRDQSVLSFSQVSIQPLSSRHWLWGITEVRTEDILITTLRCHCQEKCPLLYQALEKKLAVF